jgi:hypothetical protein
MAKKVLKGLKKVSGIGIVGTHLGLFGKKKKAAAPVDGQPIVTPLNAAAADPKRRAKLRAPGPGASSSILSDTLGG